MSRANSLDMVAKEAGVALSTASRALSGSEHVKAETRQRVEAAVERLGYQVRRPGRPAHRPTKCRVAVTYSRRAVRNGQMSNLSREWIKGIRHKLEAEQAHLNVLACTDRVEEDRMFLQGLKESDYSGIILIGPEPEDGYLQRVVQAGLPTVVFNRLPQHHAWSCITVDAFDAGQIGAEHLFKLGHRRIALLMDRHWQADELREGQLACLRRLGLEPVLDERFKNELGPGDDYQAIAERVVRAGATGVLTVNDQSLVDLADALEQRGVRVPQDVSLVGFDAMGLKTQSGLRLTSINYDKHAMGGHAASVLLRMLKPSSAIRSVVLSVKTQLYAGQTTAKGPESDQSR